MSNTGGEKALDGARSYGCSPQKTYGYSVLATLTKGRQTTTSYQNGLQAMDVGG